MNDFSKARRLLTKSDYAQVFSQANKLVTSEFVILHRNNTLGIARLGMALSKKKIAKASQRNKIKRLLRESFRHQQLPAIDLIFLAHKAQKVDKTKITANLGKAWEKLTDFYVK